MRAVIVVLFCACLFSGSLSAQRSNERVQVYANPGDSLTIDTLSLIPGSVFIEELQISGADTTYMPLDSGRYILAHFSATIRFMPPYPAQVRIRYQVFPYLFTQQYYKLDPTGYDSTGVQLTPYTISSVVTPPYLDAKGLDYNGSFARGISFGNNQDVVVNSTFNLQMNGKLQNDVNINASITDNNIPIQPEGNTQQLQEFDKVFIKLSKDAHQLTMGDFEMYDNGGYFMQFYKKLQGASYAGNFKLSDGSTLESSMSAAVARGIHVRQQLEIIEGNQGPYKLKGNNGETFIIILAGTERIFMDGMQLVRGAEQDYIIDYNAGEITFTPNILLTKDRRIYVEFEYADRQYFRTLLYTNNNFVSHNEQWQMRLQVYSEQDSKNQPLDQTLGSSERAILESAGDSTDAVLAPGISEVEYDASRILYKMIDSLGFDSVFVYSIDPDSAKYALSFTELGVNQGNYVVSNTAANGKVYKWVAPVAGVPQGTAEPLVTLAAPRKAQMISIGGTYTPDKNKKVTAEVAISNNDPNTFSVTGNDDNTGVGVKTGYIQDIAVTRTGKLTAVVDYEFAGKTFSPLERFRPVEFTRNWSIYDLTRTNEHYANAGLQYSYQQSVKASYNTSLFIREGYYNGFLQTAVGSLNTKKWKVNAIASYLNAGSDTLHSTFIRPRFDINRTIPSLNNWKTGAGYEGEHNYVSGETDSLLASSFYYDQFNVYFGSSDTAKRSVRGDVILRNDKAPSNGSFAMQTQALTYQLQGNLREKPQSQLHWQLHYRTLRISDTALTVLDPENTLLGRLQHTSALKKGLFTSEVLYEIGTGREQKRSYTFVETEPGAGVYTWNDYNENGAQELNEFEIAVFSDQANFVQIFVPTDEYIQTNTTNFNYAIGLNPKVIWHNAKGLEGLIGKFALQSNLQLNRKVFDDQSTDAYNPFAMIDDSLLVSSGMYWVNTLFFNRTGSKFGMDYSYISNFNKQVITVGPESREKMEHKTSIRYRPTKSITLNGTYYNGVKGYTAEAFTERNYVVPYTTYEPKISYTLDSRFRVTGMYQFTEGQNTEGGELLKNQTASLDMRYNIVSKSTINLKFSYVVIEFSGEADSPVGYAMLEGLQNGNNILWSLNIDRKLSQVLQLTAGYEGRKTGDNPITHIGRLQVRAVF